MSNVPRIDFAIFEHLIRSYQSTEWLPADNPRMESYRLEHEASTLLFLEDELKELTKHVTSRLRQIEDELDNEV